MNSYQDISTLEFIRAREKDPGIQLIDVRTPGEYFEVHAADSELIPLQDFSVERVRELGFAEGSHVYIICRSGARSAQAGQILINAGFENVYNLEGGILEWERMGMPVIRFSEKKS